MVSNGWTYAKKGVSYQGVSLVGDQSPYHFPNGRVAVTGHIVIDPCYHTEGSQRINKILCADLNCLGTT